jgi:hypothetical protein
VFGLHDLGLLAAQTIHVFVKNSTWERVVDPAQVIRAALAIVAVIVAAITVWQAWQARIDARMARGGSGERSCRCCPHRRSCRDDGPTSQGELEITKAAAAQAAHLRLHVEDHLSSLPHSSVLEVTVRNDPAAGNSMRA